ncbi:MAG: hypothetical protein JW740_01455 [Candidatus Zambryskibacteria bacterium]|nr:hypothetical protein [Candidatus Zambryskibacteria bacterium]
MKKLTLTIGVLVFPLVSFAALGNIEDLTVSIGNIINLIIPILFALALLAFFWGLVKYIFSSSDEDKSKAKKTMIWGIIALFIMASVWGLVNFIQSAVGVDDDAAPDVQNLIPN